MKESGNEFALDYGSWKKSSKANFEAALWTDVPRPATGWPAVPIAGANVTLTNQGVHDWCMDIMAKGSEPSGVLKTAGGDLQDKLAAIQGSLWGGVKLVNYMVAIGARDVADMRDNAYMFGGFVPTDPVQIFATRWGNDFVQYSKAAHDAFMGISWYALSSPPEMFAEMYTARYAKKVLPAKVGHQGPGGLLPHARGPARRDVREQVMQTRAPVDADRLAAAARAQAALPDARVFDARRAWAERVPDVWGVTVEGRDRTSNAFLHVSGDRVAVPAGLSHAARVLSELDPFDGEPWGGGLVYIVTAAGGTTPGFPDSWHADETPLPDGGVRLTVPMPERWVAYATAGGVGPAPANPSGPSVGGGVTAPPEMATATLDIGADYGLQWRYQLADGEIDGPSGAPAGSPPALPDDQLVAALDGARLPRPCATRRCRRASRAAGRSSRTSSSSTCGRSDPCTSRPTGPARASTGAPLRRRSCRCCPPPTCSRPGSSPTTSWARRRSWTAS